MSTLELVAAGAPRELLARLRQALDGGPAVRPYVGAPPPLPAHDPATLPPGLALAVGTSGSTGEPKLALHDATSLRASAAGTDARLAGPGQWLLAIPAHHIAGLQVLVRSILAATTPVLMTGTSGGTSAGFTAAGFAAATRELTHATAYTSLVPTQVARLLDDPGGVAALRRFAAVLVGGSAVPRVLRERAAAAGVHLVATYGMSESAGGCVYDGQTLPDVRASVDGEGRVHLGGPVIAHGYLGRPDLSAALFRPDPDIPGVRWFATDDLGAITAEGELRVHGRIDDVITTGGLKVHPRVVEEAVRTAYPGLSAAVVVGVPDPEWGSAIALVIVGDLGEPLAAVRERLRAELAPYALPRLLHQVDALPERGPGKPDRRAIAAMVGQ